MDEAENRMKDAEEQAEALAEELDTERQVDRQSVSFLYYFSDCPFSVRTKSLTTP